MFSRKIFSTFYENIKTKVSSVTRSAALGINNHRKPYNSVWVTEISMRKKLHQPVEPAQATFLNNLFDLTGVHIKTLARQELTSTVWIASICM